MCKTWEISKIWKVRKKMTNIEILTGKKRHNIFIDQVMKWREERKASHATAEKPLHETVNIAVRSAQEVNLWQNPEVITSGQLYRQAATLGNHCVTVRQMYQSCESGCRIRAYFLHFKGLWNILNISFSCGTVGFLGPVLMSLHKVNFSFP